MQPVRNAVDPEAESNFGSLLTPCGFTIPTMLKDFAGAECCNTVTPPGNQNTFIIEQKSKVAAKNRHTDAVTPEIKTLRYPLVSLHGTVLIRDQVEYAIQNMRK